MVQIWSPYSNGSFLQRQFTLWDDGAVGWTKNMQRVKSWNTWLIHCEK